VTARVLILGVGNSLMGDDGVGAAVVDLLLTAGLPADSRAVAVPDVFALAAAWRDETEVWIVDAMMRESMPGTIHHLSHDDVLGLPRHATSAHHIGLAEGLRWICHTFPRMAALSFRLWGVEPARVAPPEGLTDPVAAAARTVSDEMLNSLTVSRQICCD
jgi:hydrogenase maturation protease